jgi:hypothetical protein
MEQPCFDLGETRIELGVGTEEGGYTVRAVVDRSHVDDGSRTDL